MFDIRLLAVFAANDDGSQAFVPDPTALLQSVDVANQVFNPHGVSFVFDPKTDIVRINDDRLNHEIRRRDAQVLNRRDIDPNDGPGSGWAELSGYKNEVARRFRGRLVVYFSPGTVYFWSEAEHRWKYSEGAANYSDRDLEYVGMHSLGALDWLAHEIGHYFHLPHTHNVTPGSIAEAVQAIQNHVNSGAGTPDTVIGDLFDFDSRVQILHWPMITDTPPDPGGALFHNQCDPAETSVTVTATFARHPRRSYTFTPDRDNVMSYWNKGAACRGTPIRLSPQQGDRVRNALVHSNRRHLVDPQVLYSATFAPGDRSQTGAFSWALNDLATRFDDELRAARRCVHLQAYPLPDGQIRYDGIWEPAAGVQQSRALGWNLNDMAARFDKELAIGKRCVHLQAYDLGGGQIRYDGIWESGGDRAQSRALGWTLNDMAARFDRELAAGKRCVHLQAYDLGGGQIRYDGIWEKAEGATQTRAISWTLTDIATRFNRELAAGRRCVHLQAYDLGGGQIRYDGVWESGGSQGQRRAIGWATNDFIRRWQQEADAGNSLVHLQAYDLGGGQIRYDGIWQPGPAGQTRLVGVDLDVIADRFAEATTAGALAGGHLERLTACRRNYHLPATLTAISSGSVVTDGAGPSTPPWRTCALGGPDTR